LAQEGEQLTNLPPMARFSDEVLPHAAFSAWRTRCLAALRAYLPDNHPAVKEFDKAVEHPFRSMTSGGGGILLGLADAAEDGYLFARVTNLIAAEVFGDFLEMAEHLVEANHFHAAAWLVGAVLEDSLRRMADQRGIPYTRRDGIDSLNKALAKAGVYNAVVQKKVDVWRVIRNPAAHGDFDEVRADGVREMLAGVSDFVGRHLQ